MVIQTELIKEAPLYFGGNKQAFDPRVGLLKYGPRGLMEDFEVDYKNISVGMIGTPASLSSLKQFLEIIKYPIRPQPTLYGCIGFPGLHKQTPLKFSIKSDSCWEQTIYNKDIEEIEKTNDIERHIKTIELFEEKIRLIAEQERPELILISIPESLIEIWRKPKLKTDKIKFAYRSDAISLMKTSGDADLHHIIKVIGLKYKIPTQLVLPSTLQFKGTEDKVTTAWNISVAIYYKANGLPWKLTNLKENTLYVGISFYKEYSDLEISTRASLAQIFLQTGESFILRGDPFQWDDDKLGRTPYLSENDAQKLIDQIFTLYYKYKKQKPNRIVIHKTSNFIQEEMDGFQKATRDIEFKDFITILNTSLRFYRQGSYPILRGTLIITKNDNYLFTTGFTPHLYSYPGSRVPEPILIRPFQLDTSIVNVSEEIMTLTRLDWNNAKFNIRKPVTISISRKVGEILAESRAKEVQLDPHYRFYM